MRNILFAQVLLVPLVAVMALLFWGRPEAIGALYGGGIALGNSLLMARRVVKATTRIAKNPESDVRSMYVGALERFAFTLGAMGVGMGGLGIHPVGLLAGFALGQLGYPLGRAMPDKQRDVNQES